MRRVAVAVVGLAAGTSMLVVGKGGEQARSSVVETAAGDAAVPSGPAPAAVRPSPAPAATLTPEAPTPSMSGASGDASAAQRMGPTAQPKSTGSRTAKPRPTRTTPGPAGTTTAPAPPPPPSQTFSVTGPVVSNPYGDVQVKITMKGSRLADVTALVLPQSSSRSRDLSDRAEPLLRQEALSEQGADLDTVSGATFTSEGYEDSLQKALDDAAQGRRD